MMDDSINHIMDLIAKAKAEGKAVQFGESECCFCHTDLGGAWHTLSISPPACPPMMIRLCRHCAHRFDIETGIFGLVNKG